MQVIIENNTTNFKRYFEDIDIKADTPLYRSIELHLNDLDDGEYTLYLLNNANELITKELIRVGDFQINELKTKKKYTQYVRK